MRAARAAFPVVCIVIAAGQVLLPRSSLAQPSVGSWTTLAPQPSPRSDLAAAAGPDGRIYAIGGGINENTVEAYDPSSNTWTAVAPMPTPRQDLAAAAGKDGRIYAIGGWNSSNTGGLNTLEVYNPTANRWTAAAPMPTARSYFAASTGSDGRIYAIGGCCKADNSFFDTVEAYDPATNTWSTVAPLPTPRSHLAAATGLDGRLYAIGGWSHGGFDSPDATVDAYDPRTDTWSAVAPMLTARHSLAAASGSDGRIYAIGGFSSGADLGTVEVYDPAGNTWSTVAPMPTARSSLAAARGQDGRIYAIGGDEKGTVEAYTPPGFLPPTPRPTASPAQAPTQGPTTTPTPTLTPSPTLTATPRPPSLGAHPTAARLFKASLRAMATVKSVRMHGGITEGHTAVRFTADCSADRMSLSLTVPRQAGVATRQQVEVIFLGNGAWTRVKAGTGAWTRWKAVTGVDTIPAFGFATLVYYLCPQQITSNKSSSGPVSPARVTSTTIGGQATWHLHISVSGSPPGTIDFYISKATLHWVRLVVKTPAQKQVPAQRYDVRYTRFNVPVNIRSPL